MSKKILFYHRNLIQYWEAENILLNDLKALTKYSNFDVFLINLDFNNSILKNRIDCKLINNDIFEIL